MNKVNEVTQLTVALANRPGELYKLIGSLGLKTNIWGLSAEGNGDASLVRFIVDRDSAPIALAALQQLNFRVLPSTAFEVELPDAPKSLADFVQTFGAQGVNIRSIYATGTGNGLSRVVFSVDDLPAFNMLIKEGKISIPEIKLPVAA